VLTPVIFNSQVSQDNQGFTESAQSRKWALQEYSRTACRSSSRTHARSVWESGSFSSQEQFDRRSAPKGRPFDLRFVVTRETHTLLCAEFRENVSLKFTKSVRAEAALAFCSLLWGYFCRR